MAKTDRELGMDRPITRRDFLNGVSLTVGGALVSPARFDALTRAQQQPAAATDYYPPVKTGLRGSHPGSFEVAHGLRNGNTWGAGEDTGESYDLVIVGGGMAGLSAAYYFKKSVGREAKVLILDNHDDFGGHAKRNEFTVGERRIIGYGGSQSLQSPNSLYSPVAKQMLRDLGVDISRVLHGEQEFEIHRPIKPGETFLCRSKVLDIYEKTGKSGPMAFVVREITITDRQNEIVGAMRHITVVRL